MADLLAVLGVPEERLPVAAAGGEQRGVGGAPRDGQDAAGVVGAELADGEGLDRLHRLLDVPDLDDGVGVVACDGEERGDGGVPREGHGAGGLAGSGDVDVEGGRDFLGLEVPDSDEAVGRGRDKDVEDLRVPLDVRDFALVLGALGADGNRLGVLRVGEVPHLQNAVSAASGEDLRLDGIELARPNCAGVLRDFGEETGRLVLDDESGLWSSLLAGGDQDIGGEDEDLAVDESGGDDAVFAAVRGPAERLSAVGKLDLGDGGHCGGALLFDVDSMDLEVRVLREVVIA